MNDDLHETTMRNLRKSKRNATIAIVLACLAAALQVVGLVIKHWG